jgi:hypothetical protein
MVHRLQTGPAGTCSGFNGEVCQLVRRDFRLHPANVVDRGRTNLGVYVDGELM